MPAFETIRQSSRITPPTSGNVVVVNVSTTQQVVNLAAYRQSFVWVQPDGANVYVLFSSNATLANALNVTATTGATSCWKIPDASNHPPFWIDNTSYQMGIIAGGSVQVRIYQSSPPRRN